NHELGERDSGRTGYLIATAPPYRRRLGPLASLTPAAAFEPSLFLISDAKADGFQGRSPFRLRSDSFPQMAESGNISPSTLLQWPCR
ncbi:hypothetical protein NKJ16_31510, partial [Mesorhizobium sp. M0179]|uniref:hypothetical protein n=1 Tax=Mesorhizobium sp. M0179 TaxID=2956905 RepID=UPI00333C0EC1